MSLDHTEQAIALTWPRYREWEIAPSLDAGNDVCEQGGEELRGPSLGIITSSHSKSNLKSSPWFTGIGPHHSPPLPSSAFLPL